MILRRREYLRTSLGIGIAFSAGCNQIVDTTPTPNPTHQPEQTTRETSNSETPSPTITVTDQPVPDIPTIGLRTIATGFQTPLDFAVLPDTPNRQYVVEQHGVISVIEDGELRSEPFLDLTDRIITGGERGLLGLAFHPSFESTNRCYVRYSAWHRSGTPNDYTHTFVLSEFQVSEDGLTALRSSERTLLEIPQPQTNHNSGSIVFGPDGFLYVGVGDGGGGGDTRAGHVDDWYDGVGGGNGQDITQNLLGSILRIDVNDQTGSAPYRIPSDNPLVGQEGLDEQWAWGFRNPWGMSFDGDDLFVADVGQSQFEEVNLVERGGNYGWNVREGYGCFRANSCPSVTPTGEQLRDPVFGYPNRSSSQPSGIAIIGGHVYRGTMIPGLTETYVFGDLAASGRLFVATPPVNTDQWHVDILSIDPSDQSTLQRLFGIGRDTAGELYLLASTSNGGAVHQLVPVE